MNTLKEKCQVVILPIKEECMVGELCSSARYKDKLLMFGEFENSYPEECKKQHLYILSNDEIKKDDWVFIEFIKRHEPKKNPIKQFTGEVTKGLYHFTDGSGYYINTCKKIIATTNESLKLPCSCLGMRDKVSCGWMCKTHKDYMLPQPSQAFIEKFIKLYNQGNPITDVLVEYEEKYIEPEGIHSNRGDFVKHLKINHKDNTITIHPVKDSWNREEVISLIKEFRNGLLPVRDKEINYTDDFIKENL